MSPVLIAVAVAALAGGVLAVPLLARSPALVVPMPTSGPAADYPMVLGAPFVVDGKTYTPADTMNYDQVGYAASEDGAVAGISLAHRTLPLPSYVEVTSLRTGRTILVRVERRGPMTGTDLVALSPAAAAQLGLDGHTPVRVRRVNPPESERALLRAGQTAPLRMDTPMSLVGVLLRKLDPALAPPAPSVAPQPAGSQPAVPAKPAVAAQPAVPAKSATAAKPAAAKPVAKPAIRPAAAKPATTPDVPTVAAATPKPAPSAKPSVKPSAKPASTTASGAFAVQVGAFSTRARAETAARQVGGTVSPAGKLFRVRIGGFAAASAAAGALAKAKGAGYSDARIQRAD